MFSLEYAGFHPVTKAASFEVRTRRGGFCGFIAPRQDGTYRVLFSETKGSARKFTSVEAAVQFIRDRRAKKGWGI